MSLPPRQIADRFWEKVNKNGPVPQHRPELGPCWEWTSTLTRSGYGQISVGGRNGSMQRAHRVAWELQNGSIPSGKCVLHHCDNRKCVRNSHLWIGTSKENAVDMADKNRRKGELQASHKLKNEDVFKIRELLASRIPQRKIASLYGISQDVISRINTRHIWNHI